MNFKNQGEEMITKAFSTSFDGQSLLAKHILATMLHDFWSGVRKLFRQKTKSFGVPVLVVMMLTGCTIEPRELDNKTVLATRIQDRKIARSNVAPINGRLSLEEAMARAIKYNLDHRVRLMEQSVARGDLDLSRYDMLPIVLAEAGYSTRDKPSLTRPDPTISAEQSKWDISGEVSWGLLDFGASYFKAQQNANRLMAAAERRRRAMHLLIMDVQTAYWRAASAQSLAPQVKATLVKVEQSIKSVYAAKKENTREPIENLKQLRALLRTRQDIHQVQKELLASEVELANLINAPINKSLTLEPPVMVEKSPKVLSLPIEDLEKVALYNNAELKEQSYDVEIAALETRSALLDLLPDLTLSVGRQYTSDSYVINNEWHQGALSISYNLLSLLNVQGVKKQAAAREDLAKMRRVAMQMTVVAQVHLAAMQAKNTLANLQNAAELHEVERKIEVLKTNQRTAGKISQTELVRAQTSSLVAELRRYQALAGFHSAMGRLQASLGLEPNISSIQSSSLPQIESEVQKSITGWYSGDVVRREISLISQIE